MDKPDFERAKRFADGLRLQQKAETRLDIQELIVDSHIIIDSIQNYAQHTGTNIDILMPSQIEGCLKIWDPRHSLHLILYNDEQYPRRKKWGVAHELGHTYLGHPSDDGIQEVEAHCFAAEFLAPDIALRYVQKRLPEFTEFDVCFLFGISEEAAKRRLHTIQTTIPFYTTYAEKDLLNKLRPELDAYIADMKAFYAAPIVKTHK